MKKFFHAAIIPITAILLALILFCVFFISLWVPSGSMEPALPAHAWVIGWRLAYNGKEPAPGDVVVFRHKSVDKGLLLKRVAAVGGQTVEAYDGTLWVNGQAVSFDETADFDSFTVPVGYCFLLGDNRKESYDSRFWEEPFVPYDDIIAKACYVIYPKFIKLGVSIWN